MRTSREQEARSAANFAISRQKVSESLERRTKDMSPPVSVTTGIVGKLAAGLQDQDS
jgi:hypothetical protein